MHEEPGLSGEATFKWYLRHKENSPCCAVLCILFRPWMVDGLEAAEYQLNDGTAWQTTKSKKQKNKKKSDLENGRDFWREINVMKPPCLFSKVSPVYLLTCFICISSSITGVDFRFNFWKKIWATSGFHVEIHFYVLFLRINIFFFLLNFSAVWTWRVS